MLKIEGSLYAQNFIKVVGNAPNFSSKYDSFP